MGSKRYCKTAGFGTLDETFLHWDEPRAYVYNVKNFTMPIKDNHAAVMILQPVGEGKTKFTWLQYIEYKGLVMRHIFPHMMRMFMNRGFKSLKDKFGGSGGQMQLVQT